MSSRHTSTASSPLKVAAPTSSLLFWLWAPLLLVLSIDPLIQLFAGKPPFDASINSWGGWLVLPLVGGALTLAYLRRELRLEPQQLTIAATLYTRRVPLSSMRLDRARVVNFAENPDFKPGMKSNGFQFPGFRAGHFHMKDGGKGFCLITDDSRVLVIPLRDGNSVLISPEQPRALLEELKQLADSRNRA
ncbi:PH domain-containing protein [Stenotrophomonas sp. Iso1]|uniref:PH domain-containing protein n=1 Tax=Stenotrophomonas sp. Iso1 TaxID=2977283 RepID=UPI0022B7A039|nr:PH domain-containing protein [Stenotrophomonas sp. Iso1]